MGNSCCRQHHQSELSEEREYHTDVATIDTYHTQELTTQSFDELNKFTFNGLITKAKVVDVYDGDTVTLVFYFNDIPIKDSFRMFGYDAPEIKPSKTIPHRDLHIIAGHFVRDFLKQKILGQLVWVKFCQEEKYGRLMGYLYMISPDQPTVFSDADNINELMISKGYGKPYRGGHKSEFSEQELIKILAK